MAKLDSGRGADFHPREVLPAAAGGGGVEAALDDVRSGACHGDALNGGEVDVGGRRRRLARHHVARSRGTADKQPLRRGHRPLQQPCIGGGGGRVDEDRLLPVGRRTGEIGGRG